MGLLEEVYRTNYDPPIFIKYTELFDYTGLNKYHVMHPVDVEEAFKFLFKALDISNSFVLINICGDTYYVKNHYGDIDDEIYELILAPDSKLYKRFRMEYKMDRD